ncbi:bifunctional UDP-N-acetylmuramoyl-tripeptide:D-alanyl-D-alanine ligase/alanine racemase [Candidatus Cardinium hertigii]|nr:bifunctional UDP-N-acetylmuramoyl-tripeptide:D-alanyl-D-alanine ligase/alanine racemase [Candidatus Cardinium hertigii]
MPLAYFNNLVAITNGQVVIQAANSPITELTIDSRNKTITQFPLFFAIVGINHNGHDYIEEAYEKGIRQFVVESSYNLSILEKFRDLNILQVIHTVEALQQFMVFYRSKYRLPVLGITGSNGKTIVKEWMHAFLSSKYKTVSNPSSYNSQVGVPLAVSLLQPSHQYAVFEAGITTADTMAKLALLIQPTHGLFTNIGPAHSQGFRDITQKIEEKAQLFAHCSTIYYCKDHQLIDETLLRLYGTQTTFVNWSFYNPKADYLVVREILATKTKLQIIASDTDNTFLTSFQDNASIENITHCLVYLLHNGFDPGQLQRSLLQLKSIPMRITLKAGMHRCQIIDDTYTHELASLRIALDFMQQQHYSYSKQTVILSDIVQSSTPDQELYKELALLLAKYAIHRFIGIGPIISQYATLFSMPQSIFFGTVEDFMQNKPFFQDEVILVKGARTFRLERIVRAIEKKCHGTVLEISMRSIRNNLSYFRAQLAHRTKIMAIVKASAYGNDSEIPAALQRHGVDYFGVAYVDEGIYLRNKGITLPIMVMNPTYDSFDAMVDYQLEPEIYSLELLDELSAFIAERAVQKINIHLKIETGMYRLGIEEGAIDQLLWQLKELPNIHVASIFSHLVGAESKEHDDYSLLQAKKFIKIAQYIERHLAIKPLKHLVNTNGLLRFPQFQFDMVRLGIGLYGVGVDKTIQSHLFPASTLKTIISQVKQVQKGETIGYNRKGITTQDTTIATIPIGYADGFSRLFGCGKGSVVIHDRYCPTIGTICMDMAMIDVTGIKVKRGDEVIIFSAEHSIDELAERIGTISYELLTQISQRVKRMYYT